MANATNKVNTATVPFANDTVYWPLASTAAVYQTGAMIGEDVNGNAAKFDATAVYRFLGVMCDSAPITVPGGASAGQYQVCVEQPRRLLLTIASAAAGDEGKPVFAADDQTATYLPGALTNANYIGRVAEVLSSTSILVEPQYRSTGGQTESVNYSYGATPITAPIWTADRPYRLVSITGRPLVLGGGSGAKLDFWQAPSGTALASGTKLNSGTTSYSLDTGGTPAAVADTNQTVPLSTTDAATIILAGNTVGAVVTGTTTSATGVISFVLMPIA